MSDRAHAAAFIREGSSFVIATHLNPDGDALGSALALAAGIRQTGRSALVYDRDGVIPGLEFLPGSGEILSSLAGIETAGMDLIVLDCNKPERAGVLGTPFRRTLVIDHHVTEAEFGDVRWIDPAEPATGLMVHRLLADLGVAVTRDIATDIYSAIAVDTGTFRYPCTTGETVAAAAALIDAGADPSWVADRLYNNWSPARFRLLVEFLGSADIRGAVCVTTITLEMFARTCTTHADTENFVNFPLMVEDIRLSAAMRETAPGSWRVSLRSKGDCDVSGVAERFGGGGHRNASGCTIEGTEAKALLAAAIDELALRPLAP